MLKLYHFNNSVCSQKVRLALAEKGIEWEERLVDLFRLEQYEPAYLELNPKGVVPTLVHDGRAVVESTVICEYLDEVFPAPPLRPADPFERARMRVWTKMVDEGLHEGVTALSFAAMFRERLNAMTETERERRFRNIGDPVRRDRHRALHDHGVEAPHVYNAIAAYESAFEKLEAALAEGGEWVLDHGFSLVEVGFAPYAARLEYLTLLDLWLAGRTNVQAWWGRIKARVAYRSALAGPLSATEVEEMASFGAAIRDRVGSRRAEYLEELAAARRPRG